MKKIFYSMMAVALCACSQSEVDDMPTPPQPENNGLKFVVVDNGFVAEDGTRVEYGEGTSAQFVNGDQIGLFVIKSMKAVEGKTVSTPNECTASNIPLTLTNGVWTSEQSIDLTDATLLFAYAPYNAEAITDPENAADWRLTFTGAEGNWEIDKSHDNRFFVGHNLYDDIKTMEFDKADWMGAVAKVPSDNNTVTFNMQHMRGMIEVNTPKGIEISKLTLAVGGANGAKYPYTKPYHVTTNDKEVYRILTTEYNNTNAIYAQIKDGAITKNYMRALGDNSKGAGVRSVLTINYTPAFAVEVSETETLAAALKAQYGDNYTTNAELTSLRLTGKLQGASKDEGDWATLRSLTTLTTLDMSELCNESIPDKWIWREEGEAKTKLCETLTTLVLPNGLKSIGNNSLQPNEQLTNLELPASVTTLANGALWGNGSMSIRIPEDSQLKTIGNGAFQYTKVYTDPNDVNVLKMPTNVESIAANAFADVKTSKIIFQTEAAPGTMVVGAFNGAALIYVPNKENYAGKLVGPTTKEGVKINNTVITGPVLTADNYESDYTLIGTGAGDGIGVLGLCDNDNSTFWHTKYGNSAKGDATYGQYIDITLPEAMTSSMIRYITRSYANAVPAAVDIYTGNDGENWTKIATLPETNKTLPTTGNGMYTTEKLTSDSFTRIRFAITANQSGTLCGESIEGRSVALAELTIGEEIWTE